MRRLLVTAVLASVGVYLSFAWAAQPAQAETRLPADYPYTVRTVDDMNTEIAYGTRGAVRSDPIMSLTVGEQTLRFAVTTRRDLVAGFLYRFREAFSPLIVGYIYQPGSSTVYRIIFSEGSDRVLYQVGYRLASPREFRTDLSRRAGPVKIELAHEVRLSAPWARFYTEWWDPSPLLEKGSMELMTIPVWVKNAGSPGGRYLGSVAYLHRPGENRYYRLTWSVG